MYIVKTQQLSPQHEPRTLTAARPSRPTATLIDNRPLSPAMTGILQMDNRKSRRRNPTDMRRARRSSYPINKSQHSTSASPLRKEQQPILYPYQKNSNELTNALNNYEKTAEIWNTAYKKVQTFIKTLETGAPFVSNHKLLANNIKTKSNSAVGTHAGEAFETYQWKVLSNEIIGPGESKGVDLVRYPQRGLRRRYGEVKSSTETNTDISFDSIIHTSFNKNKHAGEGNRATLFSQSNVYADVKRYIYLEQEIINKAVDDQLLKKEEDIEELPEHPIFVYDKMNPDIPYVYVNTHSKENITKTRTPKTVNQSAQDENDEEIA